MTVPIWTLFIVFIVTWWGAAHFWYKVHTKQFKEQMDALEKNIQKNIHTRLGG